MELIRSILFRDITLLLTKSKPTILEINALSIVLHISRLNWPPEEYTGRNLEGLYVKLISLFEKSL